MQDLALRGLIEAFGDKAVSRLGFLFLPRLDMIPESSQESFQFRADLQVAQAPVGVSPSPFGGRTCVWHEG